MCDETDLHRSRVCGIGGTADFGAIGERGAEDGNKTAIQASGKTKRAFVAECRGITVAARQSPALDKGQYTSEAEAKASCPSDAVVWVNSASKIYHPSGSRSYGKTATGAYMCEQDSIAAGFRAPKLARRTAV